MVKDSKQIERVLIDNAGIPEILSVIRIAEQNGPEFITDQFLKSIKGRTDKDTFYNLWKRLRKRIRYSADGEYQAAKSPGALWKSRIGDCKSFTAFVASVLQKMCIPYDLILDYYYPDMPNMAHIYVRSKGITIDPVNSRFNSPDPHWRREVIPGISCSSVGSRSDNRTGGGIAALFIIALILLDE